MLGKISKKNTNLTKKKPLGIVVAIIIGIVIIGMMASSYFTNNTIQVSAENFELYKNKSYPAQILENCNDKLHCSVNAMQSIADNENREKVIATFEDLITLYEKETACHETAHHLGMWIYAYLDDYDESLKIAKQQCGGAVYHGVIQNFIMIEKFNGAQVEDIDIQSLCPENSNPYSIERWQCLHGLGHGLAQLYEYDVLQAVSRCDEFKPGIEQISCSKGIFMQNLVHYFQTETGDYENTTHSHTAGDFNEDRYYPCNSVPEKYSAPCYHYHVTYLGSLNDGNLKETFSECDDIVSEDMVKYCYYGFGRQLSAQSINIDELQLLCTIGERSEYHKYCLTGMMMTIINVNENPDLGFLFCGNISEQYREFCYEGLGRWVKMLHLDQTMQQAECEKAGDEYAKVCLDADFDSIKLI